MRALLFHFSSLVGLLVFLNQLWNAAEIERTVFMAFAVGLVMYTLLMIGYVVTHRIMAAMPPADNAEDSGPDALENIEERTPLNRAEQPTS